VLCLAAVQGPFAHCTASPACQLPIGVRLVGPPASTPALSHACKCVSAEQQENKMTAIAQPDGDGDCGGGGSHTHCEKVTGQLAIHHLAAHSRSCMPHHPSTFLILSILWGRGTLHHQPATAPSDCIMDRLCAQRFPRLRPNITQSRQLPMLSLGLSSCGQSTVDWLSIGRYPSSSAGEEQNGAHCIARISTMQLHSSLQQNPARSLCSDDLRSPGCS
jgi:hypothetical protein